MPRPAFSAVLALAAGCAAAQRAAPAGAPAPASYVYTCGDGFRFALRYDPTAADAAGAPRGATLRLPEAGGDREVRVSVDTAAGSARYRGRDARGDVTFWEDRGEAALGGAGLPARTCRPQPAATPWDEARLLGAEYRAAGQEPGWWVEVDEGRRIAFVGDYGSTRVAAPAPPPTVEATAAAGANRVTYAARAGARALTVEVVRQPCRDVLSGEASPTTAVVRLDGREYRGCGRWLGPNAPG